MTVSAKDPCISWQADTIRSVVGGIHLLDRRSLTIFITLRRKQYTLITTSRPNDTRPNVSSAHFFRLRMIVSYPVSTPYFSRTGDHEHISLPGHRVAQTNCRGDCDHINERFLSMANRLRMRTKAAVDSTQPPRADFTCSAPKHRSIDR